MADYYQGYEEPQQQPSRRRATGGGRHGTRRSGGGPGTNLAQGPRPVNVGCNRLIDERWAAHMQDMHLRKLRAVKSTIDTSTPKTARLARRSNAKREYMKKVRAQEIQRQNNLLIRKILDLDMHQQKIRDRTYRSAPRKGLPRSLNKQNRKHELEKITAENQLILKRIVGVKSSFSHNMFENEERKRRALLRNMAQNSRNFCGHDAAAATTEPQEHRTQPRRQRPHSSSIGRRPLYGNRGTSAGRTRPQSARPYPQQRSASAGASRDSRGRRTGGGGGSGNDANGPRMDEFEREMQMLGVDMGAGEGGGESGDVPPGFEMTLAFEEAYEMRDYEEAHRSRASAATSGYE